MSLPRLCLLTIIIPSWLALVGAQPSPKVQRRIAQAIKAVTNTTSNIDYTEFVNVFIGTDNFGDVWFVILKVHGCMLICLCLQPWCFHTIWHGIVAFLTRYKDE